ncbi:hypothetical protein [Streptomyces daliensis]
MEGTSLVLYLLTAVCGVALLAVWCTTNRTRRNAGFASKRRLKKQLSAKSVLKAHEIRPSLTAAPSAAVELTKPHQAADR